MRPLAAIAAPAARCLRPLRAQDSVIVIDPDAPAADSLERVGPPPEVVAELIEFYNDSATTRVQGDVTFPSGSRFEGRLALHRGNLRIAGRVEGPIAVANGTLHLLPGADVRGDILVIGGRLIRAPGARHEGRQRVFWDAAPVARTEEGLLELRERRRPIGDLAAARTSFQTGKVRTTLLLSTGGTYNRIEGLPIVFGPTFDLRTGRRSALKLDLRGILRTAGSDTRLADFGYQARGEFRLGRFGVAGRVYSELAPIEDHPLSPSEAGWSAFLLQRDYRDYFDRRGYGGLAWVQVTRPLRLELSRRRDDERTGARDGSLVAVPQQRPLAPQPADRRRPLHHHRHSARPGHPQRALPAQHRLAHPGAVRALEQRRRRPGAAAETWCGPICRSGGATPSTGSSSTCGGTRGSRPRSGSTPGSAPTDGWAATGFPVQRRVSLGGPDLLPGYDFRAFTCAPSGFNDPSQPALCDRVVSAQVEVRTRLGLNLGFRTRDRENRSRRFIGIEEADLVLLADAGKGWLAGADRARCR